MAGWLGSLRISLLTPDRPPGAAAYLSAREKGGEKERERERERDSGRERQAWWGVANCVRDHSYFVSMYKKLVELRKTLRSHSSVL